LFEVIPHASPDLVMLDCDAARVKAVFEILIELARGR